MQPRLLLPCVVVPVIAVLSVLSPAQPQIISYSHATDAFEEQISATRLREKSSVDLASLLLLKITLRLETASSDGFHQDALFPKEISKLFNNVRLRSFRTSVQQGRWKSLSWGGAPWFLPPPGSLLYGDLDYDETERGWLRVATVMDALIGCPFSHPETLAQTVTIHGSRNTQYYLLKPEETLCTENYLKWAHFFPCKNKSGLLSLVNEHILAASVYKAIELIGMETIDTSGACIKRVLTGQLLMLVNEPKSALPRPDLSGKSIILMALRGDENDVGFERCSYANYSSLSDKNIEIQDQLSSPRDFSNFQCAVQTDAHDDDPMLNRKCLLVPVAPQRYSRYPMLSLKNLSLDMPVYEINDMEVYQHEIRTARKLQNMRARATWLFVFVNRNPVKATKIRFYYKLSHYMRIYPNTFEASAVIRGKIPPEGHDATTALRVCLSPEISDDETSPEIIVETEINSCEVITLSFDVKKNYKSFARMPYAPEGGINIRSGILRKIPVKKQVICNIPVHKCYTNPNLCKDHQSLTNEHLGSKDTSRNDSKDSSATSKAAKPEATYAGTPHYFPMMYSFSNYFLAQQMVPDSSMTYNVLGLSCLVTTVFYSLLFRVSVR